MNVIACFVGFALWCGATGLLLEDIWHGHQLTLNHCLQPALTISTVSAACFAHRRLGSWKLISGTAFLALAIFGSAATIYATLSRTATSRDNAQADALATNRQYTLKSEALADAKKAATAECRSIGPKCKDWLTRVDALTTEMASQRAVLVDPRAHALGELADLVSSGSGKRVKAIVGVLDPVILPLFLELGSLVFFTVAFPHRRKPRTVAPVAPVAAPVAHQLVALPNQRFNEEEALRDFQRLGNSPTQAQLAQRWSVDKSTVSRWLGLWELSGAIKRRRDGRVKQVLLIAAPAPRSS